MPARALLLILFGFALSLAQTGNRRPLDDRPQGLIVKTVTFHPVIMDGKSPRFVVLSLIDAAGRDHAQKCNGRICRDVPMGAYEYALRINQNNRLVSGTAHLLHQNQWITISLGPSLGTAGDFEGTPMRGFIRGLLPSTDPTWVRLQPLYTPTFFETPIEEWGTFQFDHVLNGKWIVLVLRGEQVLYNEVHSFSGERTLDISLAK